MPPKQVFISVRNAVDLVGGREALADLAMQGTLGLYFYLAQSKASLDGVQDLPWKMGEPEVRDAVIPQQIVDLYPDDTTLSWHSLTGYFRASRMMTASLLTDEHGQAPAVFDVWIGNSHSWKTFSSRLEGVRTLGDAWILQSDLASTAFDDASIRKSGKGLDKRELDALLAIIGALVKLARLDDREATHAIIQHLELRSITKPGSKTVRKHLDRASEFLRKAESGNSD